MCLADELDRQVARLKFVYREVFRKFPVEQRNSLRIARRAWIKHRDA
ncbi:lysozyme inhibitor LprI family protein [Castellaniella sp.]